MPDATIQTDRAEPCYDCGVEPGQRHEEGCAVARCVGCGRQALQCSEHLDTPMETWTGTWPGIVECRELGWYTTTNTPLGPVRGADLNRLAIAAAQGFVTWSRERERWVRP